jgi:hypothetical protein
MRLRFKEGLRTKLRHNYYKCISKLVKTHPSNNLAILALPNREIIQADMDNLRKGRAKNRQRQYGQRAHDISY